jgi:hypothetical protein
MLGQSGIVLQQQGAATREGLGQGCEWILGHPVRRAGVCLRHVCPHLAGG